MEQTTSRWIILATAILGAAAAVIPLTIYNLVEVKSTNMAGMSMSSHVMRCFGACVAATIIGAFIVIVGTLSFFQRGSTLSLTGSVVLAVSGLALIVVPQLLGFCTGDEMPCRTITAPTLAILGSTVFLLSAIRLVSSIVQIRKGNLAS